MLLVSFKQASDYMYILSKNSRNLKLFFGIKNSEAVFRTEEI